jgi:hypothetical protein
MVLIYSHITSPRLQYICNFIFTDVLHTPFSITVNSAALEQHDGIAINYSTLTIPSAFTITPTGLLFENDIKHQKIDCFIHNDHTAFFKNTGAGYAFDIFAATFYLLSRYEEYLPHNKDSYGRYAHENALAFKENFLRQPLVNIWLKHLAAALQKKFPAHAFILSHFKFIPTYDIDIAWSYKHKGAIRNIGGFFKQPSIARIQVLLNTKADPFNSYSWLHQLHTKYVLHPIYFFLVAEKNGVYDKNILPDKPAIWQLVKQHAKKYHIGIHPSWQSGDGNNLLQKEINCLAAMSETKTDITSSRQHYIRFSLPGGYRSLINAGITNDYSMGYGSINGFRASVASSFYWYDLEEEKETHLRIHPFCFMDANSFYEQRLSAAQAYDELMGYYNICKANNGTLITIWHNNFLGSDKQFAGWSNMYEKFIAQL